jgi:hypothetical protein
VVVVVVAVVVAVVVQPAVLRVVVVVVRNVALLTRAWTGARMPLTVSHPFHLCLVTNIRTTN